MKDRLKQKINRIKFVFVALLLLNVGFVALSSPAYAVVAKPTAPTPATPAPAPSPTPATVHSCGAPDQSPITTSIDLGCKGQGNPIMDMLFAFIRLLSDGVGIVVIGSLVLAGIQFTSARNDPNSVASATKRIRESLIALIIFIFAYAILDYVIPGTFLKP